MERELRESTSRSQGVASGTKAPSPVLTLGGVAVVVAQALEAWDGSSAVTGGEGELVAGTGRIWVRGVKRFLEQ